MIYKTIEDEELREHISSISPDGREIYIFKDANARIYAVNMTKSLNQMKANHDIGMLETYILSQAYIAAALLSATIKGNDRVRLEIECGGPIRGLSVESSANGEVRGTLIEKTIPLEKAPEEDEINLLFGPGFLTVTKTIEGAKTPFSGTVMLQYGNIAKDLAVYFQESEQTPTLFYIAVKMGEKGEVLGGGGIFLQLLPSADENLIERLEEKQKELRGLGTALMEGESINEYIEREFASFSPVHLSSLPVSFSCPCSKERFSSYLRGLPEKEKKAILNGPFPFTVNCLNCSSEYRYEKEELEDLFKGDTL